MADADRPVPWTHGDAVVDGVRLHYVEAGAGPLVLLLHGFPEFWYSWRHQIAALAEAGFHAVAPDMRGYDASEKPVGVESYRIERLVADAVGLIRHFGADRAHVVGHDWGGIVAWQTALRRPQAVDRLVVLNAPHPAAYAREIRSPRQLLKSWYALCFQLPWLPEAVFRAGDFAVLKRLLRREPVRRDAFSEDDVARYRDAIARPGALTAAIHYYRALGRAALDVLRGPWPPIEAPTLLIWGERDPYLDVRLTHGLERWVPRIRVERLADASHWVQNDAPDRVNRLIVEFLREPRTQTP